MIDLTVQLPEPLYERLKQRANASQRSVEAELVVVVAEIIPSAGQMTPDLQELLAQLPQLEQAALWRVARSHLSKKDQTRLQTLNNKRQREGLSEEEARQSNSLLKQYERAILLRGKAIALLKERGQDISEFLPEE